MVVLATLGIGICRRLEATSARYEKKSLRHRRPHHADRHPRFEHCWPSGAGLGRMICRPVACACMFYATGSAIGGEWTLLCQHYRCILTNFCASVLSFRDSPDGHGHRSDLWSMFWPAISTPLSTFIVIGACWWVARRIDDPWCRKACDKDIDVSHRISPSRRRKTVLLRKEVPVLALPQSVVVLLIPPEDSIT